MSSRLAAMSQVLQELIEQAASELQSASGGAALCRITSAGSPGSRVKRAEGQWAALQMLSRSVTVGSLTAGNLDSLARAQKLVAQWQADLDRWNSHPGSSWIPYCEGGVAGLRQFIEMTRNSDLA